MFWNTLAGVALCIGLAHTAVGQQFTLNSTAVPVGGTANDSSTENIDFGDVDQDGDWDAVFCDGGDDGNDQNRIWINQGGLQGGTVGVFVDRTSTRFPQIQQNGRDIEFVDFDNDGDLDLHSSNTSRFINQTNRWWTNQGGSQQGTVGFYADETASRWVGLGGPGSSIAPNQVLPGGGFIDWSCDSDFGDLDNDGDMDLVHSSYGGAFGGQVPTRLFLNDGSGFFSEFNPSGHQLSIDEIPDGAPGLWCEGTQDANTTNSDGTFCDIASSALDIDVGDIDGDFDLDILHGARQEFPRMFVNRLEENGGTLGFRDVTGSAFPSGYTSGSGHYEQEMGDLDGDGDLDIYGLNWLSPFNDTTMRNDGNGFYSDITVLSGSGADDNEGDFIDYDLDGDLDLFVANFSGGDKLYQNNNNGGTGFSFSNVTSGNVPNYLFSPTSLDADVADVDNDGDYDIFVAADNFARNVYLENTENPPSGMDNHAPAIPHLEQAPDRILGTSATVVRAQVYDNAPYYVTWYNPTVLEYTVDGGQPTQVSMRSSGGQIFRGEIPGELEGDICYRVLSEDQYGQAGMSVTLCYSSTIPDCNSNGVDDTLELVGNDCDANGVPDECDSDCNANGIPDDCDVGGGAPDCNSNGVPDECDLDCDLNGSPDDCDIAGGASDCNSNALLDSCELSTNDCNSDGTPDDCDPGADCNSNGTPDECELAGNDCNLNGVPDECDTPPDCNLNGVPDICEVPGNDCNSNGTLDVCELSSNDCNSNGTPDDCEPGPDCNLNGILDPCELSSNDCNSDGTPDDCDPGTDCNSSGIPDACELQLNDCNASGVPDECELMPDCNSNLVPDDCELQFDCNANGVPDACELQSNDCNLNGTPDECDPDCNSNSVPDNCDISSGLSPDLNLNGIPDECDPDCNNDGVPDFVELFFGVEMDCNQNTVPDSCDIADGVSEDCDGNGVPDECDLAAGAEDCDGNAVPDVCDLILFDCNSNGIPDPCDITAGVSLDLNQDGQPDECKPDCNNNGLPDYIDLQFGTSQDADGNGVPDECDHIPFCFGDGGDQAGCTECPCENNAPQGTEGGCLNSSGTSAQLSATGVGSVVSDSLSFQLASASPNTFGILVSANNQLPTVGPCPPGSGFVTQLAPQDGLRCVGGGLLRHGTRATDSAGASVAPWGPPGGPPRGLIASSGFSVGQTRHFQVFYREDDTIGCMTGQNTSNAISTTFLP